MHLTRAFIPTLLYALATKLVAYPTNETALEERQFVFAPCKIYADLVGEGDPHQVAYHQQVSAPLTCDQENSCSVGHEETWSVTVGWSIGIGGGGSYSWIDGGFSVEESYSETNTQTCDGGPGDTICVWHRTDHTEYTVSNRGSSCDPPDDPYSIRSPNKGDYDSHFYCVVGTCRAEGDAYWQDKQAGGLKEGD